jgi:hypothetical protein
VLAMLVKLRLIFLSLFDALVSVVLVVKISKANLDKKQRQRQEDRKRYTGHPCLHTGKIWKILLKPTGPLPPSHNRLLSFEKYDNPVLHRKARSCE